MALTNSSNRRRLVAGAALVAAPAVILAVDVAVRVAGFERPLLRGAVAFAMALMLPAILGLVHLLRERADRIGLAGGALCVVGTYAAARMSSLFQLDALLGAGVEGVPADAVRTALAADPVLWATVFVPGLCFPLGLVVLGAGLFVSGAASRRVAVALAAGAVLFPVGRAIGILPALIVSDVLILLAMSSIGLRLLSRPESWEPLSRGGAEAAPQPAAGPASYARVLPAAVLALLAAAGPAAAQSPEVVTAGLRGPTRLLLTAKGNLLVAESGTAPNTGRVSIVDPATGERRTLVDGLPSGISPEGGPSGPTGLAMKGRVLYVTIGAGDGVLAGPAPGSEVPNPSPASPILSSVLEVRFSAKVERAGGGVTLSRAEHDALAAGERVRLGRGSEKVVVRLVADFPDFTPAPRPDVPDNVRASNPFGVDLAGADLYVVDASQNALVRVGRRSGEVETVATFAPLPNPLPFGPPVIDYVPDAVRVSGGSLLVTNLTGFPFPQGAAEVRRVDPATGASETLVGGLASLIDVLADGDTLYVLQFSADMLAQPPAPGRLLRYDAPEGEPAVVAGGLVSPAGLARDPRTGDLYVTEIFTGRLLRVAGE